jgi:hypothetical protein
MDVSRIVQEIDAQIAKLQQAKALLTGVQTAKSGRGRPKGSKNATKSTGTRRLSAEGRKRIAEAMKRRWAERRKTAAAAK